MTIGRHIGTGGVSMYLNTMYHIIKGPERKEIHGNLHIFMTVIVLEEGKCALHDMFMNSCTGLERRYMVT